MEGENEIDNAVVNEFVNGLDNAVKAVENRQNNAEKTIENENESLDNAVENDVDNESTMPMDDVDNATEENEISPELDRYFEEQLEAAENEIINEQEELIEEDEFEEEDEEGEFEFPDEEDEDILGGYVDDELEEKPLDEVIRETTEDSVKNVEALQDLGELAIDFLDDTKAQLCSAISGQPPSQYASGKKLNKALLKAFVAYMSSQDVKAPTPMGTLLLTLALWGLPALGTAYFHRRQAQKAKKEKANQETNDSQKQESITGEAKSDSPISSGVVDYSQTKEYKDKRRLFDLHANTGCYSRDLNGKFAKTSLAGEKPSPELQELIDKGYDNVKIRSILYPK